MTALKSIDHSLNETPHGFPISQMSNNDDLEVKSGIYIRFGSEEAELENTALSPDEISKKTGFKKQKLYKK